MERRWLAGYSAWVHSAVIHGALIVGAALMTFGSLIPQDAADGGDEDGDFAVSLVEPFEPIDLVREPEITRYSWQPETGPAPTPAVPEGSSASSASPAPGSVDAPLVWNTDLGSARAEAAREQKQLVVFSTNGAPDGYVCLGGHLMRSTTFQDPRIVDLLRRRFVVVWNNQDPVRSGRGQQATYGKAEMEAYPEGGGGENLTIIAGPDGKVLHLLKGYWSAETLLEELEFALGITPENRDQKRAARLESLRRAAARLAAEHPEEARKRIKDSPVLRRIAALQLLSRGYTPGETPTWDLGILMSRLTRRTQGQIFA